MAKADERTTWDSLPGRPNDLVNNAGLQAALVQYFDDAYSRTSDPGVEGQIWNDQGILMFSSGGATLPSLNFSIASNSQYLGTLA